MDKKQLYESIMKRISNNIRNIINENVGFDDFKNELGYRNISLILNDNTEILPEEFDDGMTVVFIKISNNDLIRYNSEILIAVGHAHYISFDKQVWQTANMSITAAAPKYDDNGDERFTGYEDTCRIINAVKKNRDLGNLPAAEYCIKQKIRLGNAIYQGYLPSIGQLDIISECADVINEIFEFMDVESLKAENLWSSTERSSTGAWALYNGRPNAMKKSCESIRTLPVFKKI